jgi:acetyl-CoA carboxylase biotin carboxylase subunit
MKTIKKVLVANRGEIAIRVFRTLREMGIQSVAVYSESDKDARFHRLADEAYCLGGITSRESYLRQELLIEIAKKSGADAIHPGYGFVSENAEFAKRCEESGIIFIGPKSHVIHALGDKIEAKKLAMKAGVPVAPSTPDSIDDVKEAKAFADKIGYPVLVKASAGGGGKGMKKVERAEEFESLFQLAQAEAISAFGDGRVFIEKYLENPRHIEIQMLLDEHGNGVWLNERECSIQRRNQKVIEEAPSAILTPEMRREMGECAIRLAKEVGYTNAGTCEFLVDKHMKFYFLEVNTRLQVEHPVTEMTTGLDLVREQIHIAEGKPLSFSQSDVKINGHAIECRIYAEDSENNFLPSIGKLQHYVEPQGLGVRVDSGVAQGGEISMYFDPMIAKLVTHDIDREKAIDKMLRALREYEIVGVETTIPFCIFALEHEAFRSGKFDTHFVQNFYNNRTKKEPAPETKEVAAALAALLSEKQKTVSVVSNGAAQTSTQPMLNFPTTNWERRKVYR